MAKVFCIDDSNLVRSEIKKVLEQIGHEVIEATNGRHALEVIREHDDIRLIFCDVNMPEMNGLEFCEEIFKLEKYRQIPILMFTTESRADLKDRAKAVGVRGWLIKPFTPSKILTVLEKVLN